MHENAGQNPLLSAIQVRILARIARMRTWKMICRSPTGRFSNEMENAANIYTKLHGFDISKAKPAHNWAGSVILTDLFNHRFCK